MNSSQRVLVKNDVCTVLDLTKKAKEEENNNGLCRRLFNNDFLGNSFFPFLKAEDRAALSCVSQADRTAVSKTYEDKLNRLGYKNVTENKLNSPFLKEIHDNLIQLPISLQKILKTNKNPLIFLLMSDNEIRALKFGARCMGAQFTDKIHKVRYDVREYAEEYKEDIKHLDPKGENSRRIIDMLSNFIVEKISKKQSKLDRLLDKENIDKNLKRRFFSALSWVESYKLSSSSRYYVSLQEEIIDFFIEMNNTKSSSEEMRQKLLHFSDDYLSGGYDRHLILKAAALLLMGILIASLSILCVYFSFHCILITNFFTGFGIFCACFFSLNLSALMITKGCEYIQEGQRKGPSLVLWQIGNELLSKKESMQRQQSIERPLEEKQEQKIIPLNFSSRSL